MSLQIRRDWTTREPEIAARDGIVIPFSRISIREKICAIDNPPFFDEERTMEPSGLKLSEEEIQLLGDLEDVDISSDRKVYMAGSPGLHDHYGGGTTKFSRNLKISSFVRVVCFVRYASAPPNLVRIISRVATIVSGLK